MTLAFQAPRLVAADEGFNHQIVETCATVGDPDRSWGERKLVSLFAKDGSLQLELGFAKYVNRNVFDSFAGLSRGREQWTVRASRRLDRDLERIGAGPIDQVTLAPLQRQRYTLAANAVIPLTLDVTCTAALPPFLERRERQQEPPGLRVAADVLRYHQMLRPSGSVWVDGREIAIDPEAWQGFRSHSWGFRPGIGAPPQDLQPASEPASSFGLWGAFLLERPDGERYELQANVQRRDGALTSLCVLDNRADGRQTELHGFRDALRFDPGNRRLLGGTIELDAGWGQTRTVVLETLGDTGFHVGTGLYFGFKGQAQGAWAGEDHLAGERYADCTDPAVARELHQVRETIVRVREGDAVGYGVVQPILVGAFPEYGLSAESSFL